MSPGPTTDPSQQTRSEGMDSQADVQHTLARPVPLEGVGFWGGRGVRVRLLPAAAGTGVRFCRSDLPGRPTVAAIVSAVQPAQFRTRLTSGQAAVDMTEHLLAAIYAAGVDNCLVECDSQELPAFDGSAAAYLEPILQAGVVPQGTPRVVHAIDAPVQVGDAKHWVLATPGIDDSLTLEYRLDYGPGSPIRPCSFRAVLDCGVFAEQIAAARTFVTDAEARHIQALGLAEHVTYRDLIVFGPDGPIDNTLRFDDECARHKLLDLVGDLALAGVRLSGKIVACRSGHALNAKMAAVLREQARRGHSQRILAAA